MSSRDGTPPNRTVIFRASPLQEMKQQPAETPPQQQQPSSTGGARSLKAAQDDIPAVPRTVPPRNRLTDAAASLLSLLASVRAGRAQIELPRLHGIVTDAVAAFRDAIRGSCSEETMRRASYALCATADDIVLNLPGQERDIAEWAQRSIVVRFFSENIGGDRFWVLLDQMIASPTEYADLLELYHACMACGFEGRYRVIAGGRSEHDAKMQRTYQALVHPRNLSATELSPRWRGILAEMPRTAFWTPLVLAGVTALAVLLLVYIGFRVALYQTSAPAEAALQAIDVQPPLKLARPAVVQAAPAGTQAMRIRQFLAPEIAQHLVEVVEDASTIRVRATAPLLFDSGKADLRSEHSALFDRIAEALNTEPGPVMVQGYTDSAHISSVLYPDNMALSQARAESVASRLRASLRDPGRISAQGFGETHPLDTNDTAAGRARNRRVEVVIERSAQ